MFSAQSQSFIAPSNLFEQINQVQNELVKLQIKREEYENEYTKIPESYRKSFAQRDRKNFLQEEIEKLNKKINEAKLFIRKKKIERERSL